MVNHVVSMILALIISGIMNIWFNQETNPDCDRIGLWIKRLLAAAFVVAFLATIVMTVKD